MTDDEVQAFLDQAKHDEFLATAARRMVRSFCESCGQLALEVVEDRDGAVVVGRMLSPVDDRAKEWWREHKPGVRQPDGFVTIFSSPLTEPLRTGHVEGHCRRRHRVMIEATETQGALDEYRRTGRIQRIRARVVEHR